MRIGILSDTHLSRLTEDFKNVVGRLFDGVDMIVHAGDMTSLEVYDYLSNWELRAVRGNMDDTSLRSILPEKRVEEISGKKVGIVHGKGPPFGIENIVFNEFKDVDVIIFGHSHVPLCKVRNNVFLFNPGSYKTTSTMGMLEIGRDIALKHVEIKR